MKKLRTRFLAVLLVVILSITSTIITVAEDHNSNNNVNNNVESINTDEPTIVVSDTVAAAGDTATVTIGLENNPGIVAMTLHMSYDTDVLTLSKVTDAGVFGTQSHKPQLTSPYTLVWVNDTATTNYTVTGTIVTLEFDVAEGVANGTVTPIEITYDYENYEIYDKDANLIEFAIDNGSVTVGKETANPIEEFTYELSGTEMIITEYVGTAKKVIIDSTYTIDGVEYTVVEIAESAFEANQSITSVTIPETVKTIGDYAFYDCTALTDVTIYSKDVAIGECALGYYYISRKEDGIVSGFIIRGYAGSTAEVYAATSDEITFIVLEEKDEGKEDDDEEIEEVATAILKVNGAYFKVNSGVTQTINNYTQEYIVGTQITLTATADNFAYWMNESNKIVSTNTDYTFNLWQDTSVTVVYKNAIENETAFVEFVSDYGQIIQAQNYEATSDITLPDGPSKLGYKFENWSMSVTDIQKAISEGETYIRVTPVYEALSGSFNVKVVYDGNDDGAEVYQNVTGYEFMQLTAKEIAGRKFAYWSDAAAEGNVLGRSTTYNLYVNGEITIYAVYVDESVELEQIPVIAITNSYAANDSEAKKVHFEATREITDGYILQEHGALYGTNTSFSGADAENIMVIDSSDVKKSIGTTTGNVGVYVLSVNVGTKVDTVVYARGYMILQNEMTGETITVYSQIVSGSYNELSGLNL